LTLSIRPDVCPCGLNLELGSNVRYFAAFGVETDMPGRGRTSARDRRDFRAIVQWSGMCGWDPQ